MPGEEWVWNLELRACNLEDDQVIYVIAELMNVNFQTAYVAVRTSPITILEKVCKDEADAGRARFEVAGATVDTIRVARRSELVTVRLPKPARDVHKLLGAVWTVVGGNRRKIAEEYRQSRTVSGLTKDVADQLIALLATMGYEAKPIEEGGE